MKIWPSIVVFTRPITGAEVMRAVEEFVNQGKHFNTFVQRVSNDGTMIGQSSGHLEQQLLVAASQGSPHFQPDRMYTQVVVMHHDWPGVNRLCGDLPNWDRALVNAMRDFAQGLDLHIESILEQLPQPSPIVRPNTAF